MALAREAYSCPTSGLQKAATAGPGRRRGKFIPASPRGSEKQRPLGHDTGEGGSFLPGIRPLKSTDPRFMTLVRGATSCLAARAMSLVREAYSCPEGGP